MQKDIKKAYNKHKKENSINTVGKDPLIKSTIESGTADNSSSVKALKIDLSMHPVTYLFVLSDLHIGASGCNMPKLIRHLQRVSQIPNAVIILNGDALQNSTLTGASNAHFDKCNPEDQLRILFKLIGVKEIKAKVILVASGNHENGARSRDSGLDPLKHFSTGMGYYYIHADYNYAVTLITRTEDMKEYPVRLAGRHGNGSASNSGGTIDQAKKIANVIEDADLGLVSHFHKTAFAKETRYKTSEYGKKKLSDVNIISSSCYEEYDQFPAQMAMTPSNTDNYLIKLSVVKNPAYEQASAKDKKFMSEYSIITEQVNIDSPVVDEIIERYKPNSKVKSADKVLQKLDELNEALNEYAFTEEKNEENE